MPCSQKNGFNKRLYHSWHRACIFGQHEWAFYRISICWTKNISSTNNCCKAVAIFNFEVMLLSASQDTFHQVNVDFCKSSEKKRIKQLTMYFTIKLVAYQRIQKSFSWVYIKGRTMHREKQNTIFNNIFLLRSMQAWECYGLLGAVAVMFFWTKGSGCSKICFTAIFWTCFLRFSLEDESAVYNETFFSVILVRETVEGYLELPKTVLKIKWRLPKSAFELFWMRLRSLIAGKRSHWFWYHLFSLLYLRVRKL